MLLIIRKRVRFIGGGVAGDQTNFIIALLRNQFSGGRSRDVFNHGVDLQIPRCWLNVGLLLAASTWWCLSIVRYLIPLIRIHSSRFNTCTAIVDSSISSLYFSALWQQVQAEKVRYWSYRLTEGWKAEGGGRFGVAGPGECQGLAAKPQIQSQTPNRPLPLGYLQFKLTSYSRLALVLSMSTTLSTVG